MPASQPLVSVIIPTYNRAHLIGETLDSVLAQTYTNWECIIVDDGSTDNTDEVVNAYVAKDPRFKYYHRPPEHLLGGNGARNYGFKMSSGDYVNWFDSDDIMHEEKLQLQVYQLNDSNHNFSICQTMVFENTINNPLGLRNSKIYGNDNFNDFICNNIKFLTQAPIFKRDFLYRNNLLFDESLVQSQERDFFIKVLAIQNKYEIIEKPLVYFRKHDSSISSGPLNFNKFFSNFKVSIMPLLKYPELLNIESKKKLKKAIRSNYYNVLLFQNDELLKKINVDFLQVANYFTYFEVIKLKLGILSMKYFNRGWIFFK